MGYHRLPSEHQYWSLDEDTDIPIVRNSMPRNQFTDIKRYVHFTNNEEADNNKEDRSFNIRPLTIYLSSFDKFKQF